MTAYQKKKYHFEEQDGTKHKVSRKKLSKETQGLAKEDLKALKAFKKEYRLWRDSKGKPLFRAKFVKLSRKQVYMTKPDGTKHKLSLRKLSISDRKWVSKAKYRKNRKK